MDVNSLSSDFNQPIPSQDSSIVKQKKFKCYQCAAKLHFESGTESLVCQYCHFENVIPRSEADIVELDFKSHLNRLQKESITTECLVFQCDSCGAEATTEADVIADDCDFCGGSIITNAQSKKLIKPRSLLPFYINSKKAKIKYEQWLNSLWFAPNSLIKKSKLNHSISGVYLPFWTYDADTTSFYRGERGDYYYVTVTRTRTNSEGKQERYSVSERRTRWSDVSGVVFLGFDDVLVIASKSLPKKLTDSLEPWDLNDLLPYKEEYLAGFKAESYQVDLGDGFSQAKEIMNNRIISSVNQDIGGDEQRINSLKTQHENVTFKHILLPMWISTYRYNKKTYRFVVNARTGEVQGERPWSWSKISLAILSIFAIGAAVFWLVNY
ncbi:hypothetical protein [Aliikangiella sp. IMCC44359]|uniref:hypothetical protein n=1 Tax=Aliikangiella sp. IMCC44359 TaxID=3459125 RepID=UPI00403ACC3F